MSAHNGKPNGRTNGNAPVAMVAPESPIPVARDAEEHLLGAVLMDPSQVGQVAHIVTATDFHQPLFRDAWRSIQTRHAAGEAIDIALVVDDLRSSGSFPEDRIGQVAGDLTRAIASVPTALHAQSYARIVANTSLRREIIGAGAEVVGWAYEEAGDVDGLLAATHRRFEVLDARLASQETGEIGPVIEAIEAGAGVRGLSTGIRHYDEWTPGLRPQEVHTIAAYTGVGKTWVMCQLINAALDQGATVAVFSLEMPAQSVMRRLMANRAGACALRWGDPESTYTAGEREAIIAARDELAAAGDEGRLRIYHDQRSLAQIGAVVRRTSPDVAFVDYVQLMDAESPRQSEYEAITANVRGLQTLAQRARCCIVQLSQVNESWQRSGGADRSMGLHGSGGIGRVSDVVMKILPTDEEGTVTLMADKNRHGPDKHAGSRADYLMDRRIGRLTPKVAATPTGGGGFIERSTGGDSW